MAEYENKPVGELAAELAAGLLRLRKGYVDAAEALLQIIQPDRKYPYEFLVYRITGYRGSRTQPAGEPLEGGSLRRDLQQLILEVSGSFPLKTEDYAEPVYDTPSLARKFNITTKTVQRWRKLGLVARKMVFPDGKTRIGFPNHSVQCFVEYRKSQIGRSVRFTQLTESERKDIFRRARRMANFAECGLSEVARRIAVRTGRAMETVRYTIRRHDMDFPDQAIFPDLTPPLGMQDKEIIYRCFLQGVPVTDLADKYHRTRGSIYRVVNEMRARQLAEHPIAYMYDREFDLPDADHRILRRETPVKEGEEAAPAKKQGGDSEEVPPYLQSLYDIPLLSREEETHLFRQYNYLKFKADQLRRKIIPVQVRAGQLKQIENYLLQANMVKNLIVRANLRLVVSIAKRHVGTQTLFELVSDGNVSLMKAVEKFDFTRGFRFSTYASWAIIRNFARSVPKEKYQLDRFSTGHEDVLDMAAGMRMYDPEETNLPELRESIEALLSQLSPRERTILTDHYGLSDDGEPRSLDQLGQELGISKERVRQIEVRALTKLRMLARPKKLDFLS